MVAKKVEDRYQTMSEVVAALEQCSSGPANIRQHSAVGRYESRSDALTFLKNAPPHTSQIQRKTKKEVPAKPGVRSRKFVFGAIGAGLFSLLVVAGVLFRVKDGTRDAAANRPGQSEVVAVDSGKQTVNEAPEARGAGGTRSAEIDPTRSRRCPGRLEIG